VQYQLSMLDNRVVVDLHMESEGGIFRKKQPVSASSSKFEKLARKLKKRDSECGLALQSRTAILQVFDEHSPRLSQGISKCVQRLLGYASLSSLKLRFFHSISRGANEQLALLTERMLVAQAAGPRIAKIFIDGSNSVGGKGPGDWFVVDYDKHTISLIHLGLPTSHFVGSGRDGKTAVYSEMSLFTVGIGDVSTLLNEMGALNRS
jgi:hypothetical protein